MNHFGSIQVREGDLVAGKYRIERVLGVGGMGVVVAARHEQLEQLVAIKFVRSDALDNDEAIERFLREARSAARLRSEHVARVLDVGRLESGAPFMVMEFLEGADLAQTLMRDGPMAVDLAASLMIQVCEAVAEAHAAGIVHRDLKPENLFLTRTVGGSPKMKVLDFGVSKSARLADDPRAKLTRTRTVLGSPLYMAPEQMRSSRDVDARGDVWALGVVLFELLTGRSPFEAETMPELCLKIVSEPPLSLAELRPVLPQEIVEIVERCLQKDRNKRYATAAELAHALMPLAPPRSVSFSGAPSIAGVPSTGAPASSPGSLFAPPPAIQAGPASGGLGRNASIPAAWGTEGRRDSQQVQPRRGTAVAWAVVVSLAVGAAAVAFELSRQGSGAVHAAPPASPGPPAVSEVGTALAPLPPAVDIPPAVVAPPVAPDPSPAPAENAAAVVPASAARAPTASSSPATLVPSVAAAAPRRAIRPTAAAASSGRPDDDIPSLR